MPITDFPRDHLTQLLRYEEQLTDRMRTNYALARQRKIAALKKAAQKIKVGDRVVSTVDASITGEVEEILNLAAKIKGHPGTYAITRLKKC